MVTGILAALKFAPTVFAAASSIFNAVTGKESKAETPEELAQEIDALPDADRAAVTMQILVLKEKVQSFDTDRFSRLTEGDAAKVAATARPEIARRAMAVLETFAWAVKVLFVLTVVEWAIRAGYNFVGASFPVKESIWNLIADAEPIAEMIWGPLIASFWVCADVIKKYMGCRERDKAQQYEMINGGPLQSSAATVEAAGGAIGAAIKAWRSK